MTALAFNYVNKKTKRAFSVPLTAFKKPTNAEEYHYLETILDKLIDEVRDEENHPLAIALQIIGENMEQFDNENSIEIGKDVSDIEMLKYLMQQNNLQQKDLAPIFGGQANVSKFLNGERSLSKKQITGLRNKFNISADFFL